jgi:hypothetical protein
MKKKWFLLMIFALLAFGGYKIYANDDAIFPPNVYFKDGGILDGYFYSEDWSVIEETDDFLSLSLVEDPECIKMFISLQGLTFVSTSQPCKRFNILGDK